MRNLLLVARREYLEQIRGRAFRLSTIAIPALFGVIIGVAYLSSRETGGSKHVVIAAASVALANDIRAQLNADKGGQMTVDVVAPAGPDDRSALTQQVAAKMIDGFLWVETPAGTPPAGTYESQSAGDLVTSSRLESALNRALVRQRLQGRGVSLADADVLVAPVSLDTLQVDKDGHVARSNAQSSFWKGYVMAILLAMTTMIYGLNTARSIIQEKTSRIFEVMLSTAKPRDLLAGKLLGVGAVGLTQIGIWVAAAAIIAGSAFAQPLLTGNLAIHFGWEEGILFPLYFVLGYLFYSALFAGLAATCETEQELQMYTPLAALPVWLSFSLIYLIVTDSNSIWSILASCFPPCAPIIMMLRLGAQPVPLSQIAISITIMVLSIMGVLWFSAKLYRIGILMYGKRATIPEILRWLRYS